MRPLGHRRQVLLFLVAMLLPCGVLVALSLTLLSHERELAEKRRDAERRRALEQLRQELLVDLERIRLEECRAVTQQKAGPGGYRSSAVALILSIENNQFVLPWERDPAAAQFQNLIVQGESGQRIREGETQELLGRRLEDAVRSYEQAERAAASSTQAAYARLLHARAMFKAGRAKEASREFRALLALPLEVADEDGVPLKLYAAERLLQAGVEREVLLEAVLSAAKAGSSLPLAACYVLTGLLEKLQPAGPEKDAELRAGLGRRIREIKQAEALRQDLPRLKIKSESWTLYGDESWLLSREPAGWPAAIIAVRAKDVFSLLERTWKARNWADLTFVSDGPGEPLGDALPGLKVTLAVSGESAPLRRDSVRRRIYYFTLIALLGATMFGASLLWRDLRREVRMAEVRSQFVSSVSHELRTPLTAIRMFAETLQLGRSSDPRTQSEYLDTIVGECERLTRLVEDMLTFSKMEQGRKTYHFRPTSLAYVVNSAARTLQYPLARQGFELWLSVEDGLPRVRADSDALEQAILNLLSNAMKYSGDARTIDLHLFRQDGEAVIRVSDRGIGIPSEEQTRIFEKFYRVPTRENQLIPGTGLGLTLVAHITKAHGGRVDVKSAPGQGSVFSIRIPLGSSV